MPKRHQKRQEQLQKQQVPEQRVRVRELQQVRERVRELQRVCHKRSEQQRQRKRRSVREICSLGITWWEVRQFSKIVLQLPTKTKQSVNHDICLALDSNLKHNGFHP